MIVSGGGKEQSKMFAESFDRVLETTSKRKQTAKFRYILLGS